MKNDKKISKKGTKKSGLLFLHLVQHLSLVIAVVLLVTVFFGAYVVVDTIKGTQSYNVSNEDRSIAFEDSNLFNQLLGTSVSDLICFGAIRGQMETQAVFDAKKVVDVTAFADRYNGIQPEYITAQYYLEDLIKWSQNEFSYSDVYMTGDEADQFLSRSSTVTTVNMDDVYQGGTVSYLNSDLKKHTRVQDVSGNLFDSGAYEREDVNATILNNRYHTVDGMNIENYVSNWGEYYELCANVQKAADDLAINYEEYLNYDNYYSQKNSNVVYYIRKTIGNETVVFSNNDEVKSNDLSVLKKELEDNCGKYIYFDPLSMTYETNTQIEESTVRYILNGYEYAYPENTQILIGVNLDYPAQDCFAQAGSTFDNYVPNFWNFLIGALVCGLIYLFLLIILTMQEGRAIQKENGEIVRRLHQEDYIPTEVMLGIAAIIGFGLFYAIYLYADGRSMIYFSNQDVLIALAGVFALVFSVLFNFFYYSFVRRIKANILWKNSLLRKLCCFTKKRVLYAYDHSVILLRVWLPFGAFVLVQIVLTLLAIEVHPLFLLILLAVDIVVGYALYHSAQARGFIVDAINRIKQGDTEFKVNENGLHGDELVLARAVNSIGESVRDAVETSMKDERLKADLITNVSHDIKTPLTSIINYVDLIKRENIENNKVKEYVEILDVKSQRLKQLTDDLVEASKISSGNIVLQWEKINLVELLNQTIGEFSEKFSKKGLIPVFDAPRETLCIEADSRRTWRIMENLFNNIFKYALQGTRIYIEIEKFQNDEGQRLVALSVKNISEKPLKVKPEELTERFIRGDESRTTEGSGLGLSIAKNLTEAQHGKLDIVMDGDLFKVILTFPLLEK